MVSSRICLATDNAARIATITMSDESLDPNYAVGYHHDPARTSRAIGVSTTVTVDVGIEVEVLAAAVINTNALTAVVRSDDGLNSAITLPSWDYENKPVFGWLDTSALAGRTSDKFYFDLAKVLTTNVIEYSALWLVTAWHDVQMLQGLTWGHDRPGDITLRTKGGHKHVQRYGTKTHQINAQVKAGSDLAWILQWEAESAGIGYPGLFLPYRTKNRVFMVDFVNVQEMRYKHEEGDIDTDLSVIDYNLVLEELSSGDPPRLT